MRKMRRNKKAFTLIELVVVIAIIGILGSLVTVSVAAILKTSEDKAAQEALTSYWKTTASYIKQVNAHMTMASSPQQTALKNRLNVSNFVLTTAECPTFTKGQINELYNKDKNYTYLHIQYKENQKNVNAPFSLVKITFVANKRLYKTIDGNTVSITEPE